MIGRQLGSYRVLAKIGRGGMGSVYLASDGDGQRVAVKVLEAHGDRPAERLGDGLRRFAQELEGLRRIEHPRIVRALGPVQFAADHHFFPMEYVRGRNLAQVLEEVGRLEPEEVLKIAVEVLEGLDAAHAAGVLHRDLKSANLLIGEDGHVKVVDFGLARAMDLTRLTLSGQLLGTPAYLSPEQARGQASRVEGDLYSLGVVLYEALTGTLPFQAETPLALLRLHLDEEPDPPSTRRPGLDPGLDALLLKALEKDPAKRFQSATAFREAAHALRSQDEGDSGSTRLETAVRGLVEAETVALEEAIKRGEASRVGRTGAILVGVAVLLGVAGWGSGLGRTPGARPPAAALGPVHSATPAEIATPISAAVVPPRSAPEEEALSAREATLVLVSGDRKRVELLGIESGQVRYRQDGALRVVSRAQVREIRYGP